MKWKKIAKIIDPADFPNKDYSYAAVPFIGEIKNSEIIIYFSVRDQRNRSHLAYAVFDIKYFKVLEYFHEPLMYPGDLGFFDDSGFMGTQFIIINGKKYIYYIGWNRSVEVPFRNAIGIVESENGSNFHFRRIFNGPIMDRSIYDPCMVGGPWVMNVGDKFLMYYLSCDKWEKIGDRFIHKYNIKIAVSCDGINWFRKGIVAINYKNEYEYAFSSPRVIQDNNLYKMWYSYRGSEKAETYRIGYAESTDGINWIRKDDDVGIDVSEMGWDGEMICYPFVFDYKGERYMLYNGNGYGKTGIGLAILEQD